MICNTNSSIIIAIHSWHECVCVWGGRVLSVRWYMVYNTHLLYLHFLLLPVCVNFFQVTKYHVANRKVSETQRIDTRQQLTYFNNSKTHSQISTYDRTFHVPEGYSSKLKRDDRQHTQVMGGLKFNFYNAFSYACKHSDRIGLSVKINNFPLLLT